MDAHRSAGPRRRRPAARGRRAASGGPAARPARPRPRWRSRSGGRGAHRAARSSARGRSRPGEPLVRPADHAGPPGGMARGTRRRIAAGPDAAIDRIDGLAGGERLGGEQRLQPGLVDAPMHQRGVVAAPTTPVGWLAAQVDGRRHRPGGQQGLGQREDRVGAPIPTGVEITAPCAVIRVHARRCATAVGYGAISALPRHGPRLSHKLMPTW